MTGVADQRAVVALLEPGAQIVLALIVGGEVAASSARIADMMDGRFGRSGPNQRHQKQVGADIDDTDCGRPDHRPSRPAGMHHRLARPHRIRQKRHVRRPRLQRLLDQIVVAHPRRRRW